MASEFASSLLNALHNVFSDVLSIDLYVWLQLSMPLAVLCYLANRINLHAMTKMFFPEAPVYKDSGLPRPRWELFHLFNWVIGCVFTVSLYWSFVNMGTSSTEYVRRRIRLVHILCFLCAAYLLGFFGVSLAYEEIEGETSVQEEAEQEDGEKRKKKKRAHIVLSEEDSDDVSAKGVAHEEAPSPRKMETNVTTTKVTIEQSDQNRFRVLFNLSVFSPLLVMVAQVVLLERSQALLQYIPLFMSLSPLTVLSNVPVWSSLGWALAGALAYKVVSQSRPDAHAEQMRAFKLESSNMERAASYPPPFPNGWYKLADSNEVARGQVISVKALGVEFAVFRSDDTDGEVCVLGAYCPHMGANMARGGRVKGKCLECPFHLWQFGDDGKVKHIPYAKVTQKNPPSADKWPSCEYHGIICVYYDAERRDPPYEIPRVPEIADGRYAYRGAWDSRDIHMHIQEFAENSTDFQHFQPLHGEMRIPWTDIRIPGITIKHAADWIPAPQGRKELANFLDTAMLQFMGRDLPWTKANARIDFVGPAGVVYFRIMLPDLGDIVMVQTHTPVRPMVLKTQFRWYADRAVPRMLVWYVVGNWIAQWKNDIMVWENKIFLNKPYLVKGDGPMMRLRRWYKQFYSEASQKAKDVFVLKKRSMYDEEW